MLEHIPNEIMTICAGLFGAAAGSFFHVCVWRIPREESIIFPGSHCPACGEKIRWYDNIPIISYLYLWGACRYCKVHIPLRYPIYELLTALLFMGIIHHFYLTPTAFLYIVVTSVLIISNGVDWDHQYIPDELSLPMIPFALLIAALAQWLGWFPQALVQDLRSALLGLCIGGGVIWGIRIIGTWVFGQEAMGFGDVKLMAYLGAFLGWDKALLCIFLAAFLGSLVGVGLKVAGKIERYGKIPFGPYLAAGAYISFLCGPELILWYTEPFYY